MVRMSTPLERPKDTLRQRRIAAALLPLEPDQWMIGTFDPGKCLVDVLTSAQSLQRREAYEAFCTGGAIRGFDAVTASIPLERGFVSRVMALYDRRLKHSVPRGAAEALQVLAAREKALRSRGLHARAPNLVQARRWAQCAVFQIDRAFALQSYWLSDDEQARPYVEFVKPIDGRLPAYLADAVAGFVGRWEWNDAENCTKGVLTPLPDLLARVAPVHTQNGVAALVVVEAMQVRYTLENARKKFNISSRESQVLRLLFEGRIVSEIAQELCLAESTVQDHIKRIIAKTGSTNRVQMAATVLGWAFGARSDTS